MELYSYSPLESSHIRLVKISVTAEDELRAQMQHVKLDSSDPIVYSALSYVWGNPASTKAMICDGKTLPITATLDAALRVVIDYSTNQLIWIDQISINQNDDDERSEQVQLMNLIYEKATVVFAWLGPSSQNTGLAIDLITRVGTLAMNMAEDQFRNSQPEAREALESLEKISFEESERLGIPFSDTASWQAFSDFYDRPWYQRVWVVQEILPARQAIVLCGTQSVSWDLVKNAAAWYSFKAEAIAEKFTRKVDGFALTQAMTLPWKTRRGSEFFPRTPGPEARPTYKWSMIRLLERFRPRLASDPRDKVYALLGVSDLGDETGDKALIVDYSKSFKEVYTDLTRAIINLNDGWLDGDLDVIFSACQRTKETDWPSWVPDWRINNLYDVGRALPGNRYQVNGKYRHLDSGELYALKVEGVMIGRASYVSHLSHGGQILFGGNLRASRDKCLELLPTYPTGESVTVAHAMTLMAGELPEKVLEAGTSPEIYAENFIGWVEATEMPRSTNDERELRYATIAPFLTLGFQPAWFETFIHIYCERRLYVTDTGYMGLGNHYMQEGDVIAVLAGLSEPCVLRARSDNPEDGYQFVGEAYCHGVVRGEGLKLCPKDTNGNPLLQEYMLR